MASVSESTINLRLLWDVKHYKLQHGGKKLFCSMLNEFPELQDRLKIADVLDEPGAEGPLFQKTLGVANGKILLIGDAVGFFDTITNEGIGIVARQALYLEKFIEPVLKENSGNLVKAMFDYSRASAQIE